jgi:hypothetical protein
MKGDLASYYGLHAIVARSNCSLQNVQDTAGHELVEIRKQIDRKTKKRKVICFFSLSCQNVGDSKIKRNTAPGARTVISQVEVTVLRHAQALN